MYLKKTHIFYSLLFLVFFGKGAQVGYMQKWSFLGKIIFQPAGKPIQPILKPISSIEDILEYNQSTFLPIENFPKAFVNLSLEGKKSILLTDGKEIYQVSYSLAGKKYHAYAYARTRKGNKKAMLIIPGSGTPHQGEQIFYNHKFPGSIHFGLMSAFGPDIDVFVFIIPNNDALTYPRADTVLSNKFICNWHVNHGGEFSASWIVGSLGFTKFLKSNYHQVGLYGLSSGGAAVMQNVLQSEPDLAIISSGFSITFQDILPGGFDQFFIPGQLFLEEPERLIKQMAAMRTQFLLTYGKYELSTFGWEAQENVTCKGLKKGVINLECQVVPLGHKVPVKTVKDFVRRHWNLT